MTTHFIEDTLHDGFVDRWLVAGPREFVVPELERFSGRDYKLQILRHYHQTEPGVPAPLELERFTADGQELRWRAYRCAEDHFVDLSGFRHLCTHLRSWAYARVVSPAVTATTLHLTANAPADVWLNGVHVARLDEIRHQIPLTRAFEAELRAGENEILVRFEAVAARECPYVMALRLETTNAQTPAFETQNSTLNTQDWLVRLPTPVPHQELRASFERIFERAFLSREVYSRRDAISVRWPDDMSESRQICIRMQDRQGRIYYEALPTVGAGTEHVIGTGVQFRDGAHRIVLMPHPDVYYLHNVRVTRELPFHIQKNDFAAVPYGTYAERRVEALADAAEREGVYSEIAKMELGRWNALNMPALREAVGRIRAREDCSDFYLVGLLGALQRYSADPAFPADLAGQIEQTALGFRYWADDPGADAMWFWSENHQILFHACEVLAGQLYSDHEFTNTGRNGAWHRERGERFAMAWLKKRAAGGFREWDSNTYFEHDALALAHLADLAEDDALCDMAAVVLDKLLFTMALNSHRGVFGSSHGRAYAPSLKGGRLELTSGMGRLLWGLGAFNAATLGSVALACARGYELPGVIAEIATARVEELWSRERHRQELTWEYDRAGWDPSATTLLDVSKVTYRTPDAMLCAALDHHPGTPGVQQHVWQATFDQDAVVFVTHPPCISEENSHRPSYWHGNVTLPRVAQWYDTLVDVRNIPAGDWLPFTHAYFPVFAFDEYLLEGGWAFARRGEGYLALTAAQGVELVTRGAGAFRELRSYGRQNVWLCQLGRAARDGDFAAFRAAVLAAELHFEPLEVRFASLRGAAIRFGWEGPLLVDGVEQPLQHQLHYESPICTCELGAPAMEIAGWEEVLRLDFGAGEEA
jgi:hypothetical protein